MQTSYRDAFGGSARASSDVLLGVLGALEVAVSSMTDVPAAARTVESSKWSRCCEPVVTAWSGTPGSSGTHGSMVVRVREDEAHAEVVVSLEDEGVQRIRVELADAPMLDKLDVDGQAIVARDVALPELPVGYHRLEVRAGTRRGDALLIVAPQRAHAWPGAPGWGVFLPLYSLRTERSWGTADLSDLGALQEWIASMGGRAVATLPLLASYLDEPFDPSPYEPVSRLFWNELYADVTASPHLQDSARARELLASAELRGAIAMARRESLIDYRTAIELKRPVLQALADAAFESDPAIREVDADLKDYARFRASISRDGPWRAWSHEPTTDERDPVWRYHVYAQWLMKRQLAALPTSAALVFDLPLGVHPQGYDAWRFQDSFAAGATAGAQPDSFFAGGQNWSFHPPHPQRIREQGFEYARASLRSMLRFARVLRIDHVMGLHRLWWIPPGHRADEGAYVRYDHESLYAILALESQRHGAAIVGEDLGTVPAEVRRAMRAHGIHRTFVLQAELRDDRPERPLNAVPRESIAALNTHDMPPFASFWADAGAEANLLRRFLRTPDDASAAQTAVAGLEALARSPARLVLAGLEDLWEETQPQNVPGVRAASNWRRPGRYTLEQMRAMPDVTGALERIGNARKGRS